MVARLDSPAEAEALETLCQAYWVPIYGFIRSTGKPRQEAEDLAQGFFARLIEKGLFAGADRERGKLRTYLLATLKYYLCDEHDRATAVKRGGESSLMPMDFQEAEKLFGISVEAGTDPSRQYDRQWAVTLLKKVLEVVREEYESNGRGDLFERLHPVLTGQSLDGNYDDVARELGVTTNALTIAVYRLRQRYRSLLCQRIADTVEGPELVAEEIAYLCGLFGGGTR